MIAFFEKLADSNLRVGLVLTVLIVTAYSNVISGPLFFDDLHFISWNEHITDFEVAEIYRTSVTDGASNKPIVSPGPAFAFGISSTWERNPGRSAGSSC